MKWLCITLCVTKLMGNLDLDTLLNLSIQQHLLCNILYLPPILTVLFADSIMVGVGTAAPVINASTAKCDKKYISFAYKKALLCVLGIPSPKLISPSQSIWFWTSKSCAMRRLHHPFPRQWEN